MKNNDEFLDIFEKRLSEFTGAPEVVLTNNCTNAILLSLIATGVKKVAIPKYTYLSVPMTLKNFGIEIEFEDHKWHEEYLIEGSNVFDSAVYFKENMYKYHEGSIQCISFHQKKRLAIGQGGAILLDDKELADKLRRLSFDGRSRHISNKEEISEHPDDIICGYHMNMTPDDATKGILLLNQLPEYKEQSYLNYSDISELKCLQ